VNAAKPMNATICSGLASASEKIGSASMVFSLQPK
jgi:hypothetical protein